MIIGDALTSIRLLEDKYDLVLIDANKQHNEILFENTVSTTYCTNPDTINFLSRLVVILNNIAHNASCKLKFIKLDRDDIYLIILRCKIIK